MQKKIISLQQQELTHLASEYLDLESICRVEMSSEDINHPIEAALTADINSGWRAAEAGKQLIRFVFTQPQAVKRIKLSFVETDVERTQEYVLYYSAEADTTLHEIVRQQWNFSPDGATTEEQVYDVELDNVKVLELQIIPDISRGEAKASLQAILLV